MADKLLSRFSQQPLTQEPYYISPQHLGQIERNLDAGQLAAIPRCLVSLIGQVPSWQSIDYNPSAVILMCPQRRTNDIGGSHAKRQADRWRAAN